LRPPEPLVIDLQRLITGHIVATAMAALTGRPGGEALVQALPAAAGGTAEAAKAATPRRKSRKAITAGLESVDASLAGDREVSRNGHGTFPRQR
jgi:hypothetical protein